MTPDPDISPDRLLALLNALCDGRLTAAEGDELNAALKRSAATRRAYFQYMDMEINIRRLHAPVSTGLTGDAARDEQQALRAALGARMENAGRAAAPREARAHPARPVVRRVVYGEMPAWRTAVRWFLTHPLGITLSHVAAVGLPMLLCAFLIHVLPAPRPGVFVETPLDFATFTAGVDAQWGGNSLAVGQRLGGEPLNLKRGSVQIDLDNGVSLILQGPARFQLDSSALMHLNLGQLTATVPHEASGYTVQTPTASVTDLGTVFGVTVAPDGSGDVQVLKGSVRAQLMVAGGQTTDTARDTAIVQADHAVAFRPNATTLASIPATPEKYVTDLRHLRVPLAVHSTGEGVALGEADPHWQITNVQPVCSVKPGSAFVLRRFYSDYVPSDEHSKWLSTGPDLPDLPGDTTYTFTTKFDLGPCNPDTARLHLALSADDSIVAVRLNAHDTGIRLPATGAAGFKKLRDFEITSGFVPLTNRLEFVVWNRPGATPNSMAFRAELSGDAERIPDAGRQARRNNE